MTTLNEFLNSYINKYEELLDIADVQLTNEYTRGWWREREVAKNKLEVLKELQDDLSKVPSKDIVLSTPKVRVFVLYNCRSIPVAVIAQNLISEIEYVDYRGKDEHLKVKVPVAYNVDCDSSDSCIDFISLRFYGEWLKPVKADAETLYQAYKTATLWLSTPLFACEDDAYEYVQQIERH